jgi:hypothetical protein
MYAFDGGEIWDFWKGVLGVRKRGVCDPIVVFSAQDGLEISRVLVDFSYCPIASWLWICNVKEPFAVTG